MNHRRIFLAAVVAAVMLSLTSTSEAQLSWSRAHATGANEGFLDVTTAPARGSLSIRNIGTFGPSVAPVIAADGTVFIGNTDGKLLAFRADGTSAWSRDTGNTGPIIASPAITSDGSVFVVTSRILTRDHRTGAPASGIRPESYLHRFTSGGGWGGPIRFPERDGISGFTSAPLNIWRDGGVEALMAAVVYRVLSTTEVWILAFSSTGGFLGDAMVTRRQDEVTGEGPLWPLGAGFSHGTRVYPAIQFPNVAIFRHPQGGAPFVLVSDWNHTLVGFTFASDGNKGQFTEQFRLRDDKRIFSSTPMVLPDGHSRIGTADGHIVFAGPNMTAVSPVTVQAGAIFGPPTRTADGRLVVVSDTTMVVLRDSAIQSRTTLPGLSYVRAAASATHVFVAAEQALVTFDANTMAEVQRVHWKGGGLWPPVIGPQGHVYAMASNVLFVFPPPTHRVPRIPTGG